LHVLGQPLEPMSAAAAMGLDSETPRLSLFQPALDWEEIKTGKRLEIEAHQYLSAFTQAHVSRGIAPEW